MFDARPALSGATYEGLVAIEEAGLTGMVTLRGAFDALAAPVKEATGLAIPETLGVTGTEYRALAWMSPDELLLFCGYDEAAELAATLDAALADEHALVLNVSDARVTFRLSGEPARLREVLAKLTPADLSPGAFPEGVIRRTRLGQVAAAIRFTAAGQAQLVCFRSVADYVFALLCNAARPGGAVNHF